MKSGWNVMVRAGLRLAGMGLIMALAGCAPGVDQLSVPDAEGWRHARATLYLGAEAPAQDSFHFSGLGAGRITVAVASVAGQRLWVSGRCDGPGTVEAEIDGARAVRGFDTGGRFAFELAPRAGTGWSGGAATGWSRGAVLQLGLTVARCEIVVRGGAEYRMALSREERFAPQALRQHDAARGGCRHPVAAAPGDALASVFAAPDSALSMTCPFAIGQARLLPDARAAFQARMAALTGAPLPEAVLEAGDIEAPIDFSRAPALEAIYLSSLHMRADFTGFMLARALAWHAARGTAVRIVLSDVLQIAADRRFYTELAARHPGIQLQLLRGADGSGGAFDTLHRANHIKAFVALARDPGRSVFMQGGRNLHDGFAFERPPDLSRWPFLRNYVASHVSSFASFFVAYRDSEMIFQGDADVRRMAAHLAGFWHRDHDTQAMAEVPQAGPVVRAGEGMMRHFLSVPDADGRALEDLYVALFDAARLRLDMTSPFLNLPPRLEAAMERALERGVAIRLVTRTEVPEPVGVFAAPLNRMFVQAHAGRLDIFDHSAVPWTLHSKLLVVDGRLAVVSSINLNQRSFYHDTENGVLILDRTRAAEVLRQIDAFERDSRRQDAAQRVSPLMRVLMRSRFVRRFF